MTPAQATAVCLARNREVLVAWCLDQVVGAADSVAAAQALLRRVRSQVEVLACAAASNATPSPRRSKGRNTLDRNSPGAPAPVRSGLRSPLAVTIGVDSFDWALSREGRVFLQAQLRGLEVTSAVGRDFTGSTRIQLHNLLVRDVQGLVGDMPGAPLPGTVLSLWGAGATSAAGHPGQPGLAAAAAPHAAMASTTTIATVAVASPPLHPLL
ncbi:hypothetical protein V8C86DRAFT_2906632 [Haematococcus lacustris]